MRVLVIVKGDESTEAPGATPTEEDFAEMGKFNEELVNAGVMLSGDGLLPSAKGKRVRFTGKEASVIDGPFAESKELVAGFWIWKVDSMDAAVEWLKRSPFQDTELEIRPIAEAEDLGEAFTPELREREERLRAQLENQQR